MHRRTDVGAVAGGRTIAKATRGPVRVFVRTETRGAGLLVVAAALALIWANIPALHYEAVWNSPLALVLGRWEFSLPLREWVNSGLMTFFFFVVGLGARRDADLGELRQARAVILPLAAGLTGLAIPALISLGFTAGSGAGHGWGTALSTDTAFTLGALSLVGPRYADRLRAYIVAVLVFDDLAALIVIAVVYSSQISMTPLLIAVGIFAAVLGVRAAGVRVGLVYLLLGVAMWAAVLASGVDPLVVGLAMGLLAYASPAGRTTLEQASRQFRRFREQPTGAFARRARASLEAAVSPNDRLAALWLPWTSYLVVPLFALANAGVAVTRPTLWAAAHSQVTLGIVVGYVVGKPIAIIGASQLVTRLSRRRLRPPVGWGAVVGAGTAAGIGFTVALLIASLAFDGNLLQQAKLGILATVVAAPLLSAAVFRALDSLPQRTHVRALLGDPLDWVDLAEPVDPEVDHIRGPLDATVTVVEYGDFECPYCGRAEPVVRELLSEFADLTYVWRHLPLDDVHPLARQAAEGSEAAAEQGAFWEVHDLLFQNQDRLELEHLVAYANQLGLDMDRFTRDLAERRHADRVDRDVESADVSAVGGTPTFFINGRRHQGAYDIDTLSASVKAAGARAAMDL